MNLLRREYYDGQPADMKLLCPKCREALLPADVDEYGACPYCGTVIPVSEELEDYKMQPIVSRWINRTVKNFAAR